MTVEPEIVDLAMTEHQRARALRGQGALVEAEAAYREVVRLRPDFVAAHNELGTLLWDQRRFAEAKACHLVALAVQPNLAESHNHLGSVLRSEGQSAAAIQAFRRAVELDPNYAAAHCNLADTLNLAGWTEETLFEFRRASELAPHDPDIVANYGVGLMRQGQLDAAIEQFRAAIRLDGQHAVCASLLLYALNFHPGCDPESISTEHRNWARQYADPLTRSAATHLNDRTPDRRLRVGYVSPHFRAHAVNFFTEPILAAHDHRAVEVFCYNSALISEGDATTRRLQGHADHWREIAGLSDQQTSELVRHDRIDILVDLTGHLSEHRLFVFARKPAPVQVTYIGYQNTTGMLAMDYRLTDDWSDPPGSTDRLHTERLVRIPGSFFTYLPSADAPPVTALPAMTNRLITFGSLNNYLKVTPQVLTTWAQILAAVPRSRLILQARVAQEVRDQIRSIFERQGVSTDRIEVAGRRSRAEYLKLINRVDIALDPFPFNGHTTTCDCLWQGVPVVSLAGQTYASRFGSSALVNLDLQDLIADTREGYLDIARHLAADLDRLARLRGELRERMRASILLDAVGFTRKLEAAYRRMWTDWCLEPTRGTEA